MVEIVEKRNELSQSGDSTNRRKRKKTETSGVENDGRRKFSPGNSEYLTKQSFIEEVSNDDDSSMEETDPDPDVDIDIVEEDEEGSDPDVVIVAEEEEEDLEEDEDEIDPDATPYYKSEIESSTDAVQKNPKKILEESEFLKFIARRTQGRYERKCFGEFSSVLDVDCFRVPDSSAAEDSPFLEKEPCRI
nr:glutamic acid-rich protein-like [Solanum lycopersicum]